MWLLIGIWQNMCTLRYSLDYPFLPVPCNCITFVHFDLYNVHTIILGVNFIPPFEKIICVFIIKQLCNASINLATIDVLFLLLSNQLTANEFIAQLISSCGPVDKIYSMQKKKNDIRSIGEIHYLLRIVWRWNTKRCANLLLLHIKHHHALHISLHLVAHSFDQNTLTSMTHQR